MTLVLHGIAHWLRRGHFAEFFTAGDVLLCKVCDLGTPTGSSVRPVMVPFA